MRPAGVMTLVAVDVFQPMFVAFQECRQSERLGNWCGGPRSCFGVRRFGDGLDRMQEEVHRKCLPEEVKRQEDYKRAVSFGFVPPVRFSSVLVGYVGLAATASTCGAECRELLLLPRA